MGCDTSDASSPRLPRACVTQGSPSPAGARLWSLFGRQPPARPVRPPYTENDSHYQTLFSIDFQPSEQNQAKFDRISDHMVDQKKFRQMIDDAYSYIKKKDWKTVAEKTLQALAFGCDFWVIYTLGCNLPALQQQYLTMLALEKTLTKLNKDVQNNRADIVKKLEECKAKMREPNPLERGGRVCVKYWQLIKKGQALHEQKKYSESCQQYQQAMDLVPHHYLGPYLTLCTMLYNDRSLRDFPKMQALLERVLADEPIRTWKIKQSDPQLHKYLVQAFVFFQLLRGKINLIDDYYFKNLPNDYYFKQLLRRRRIRVELEHSFDARLKEWGWKDQYEADLKITLPYNCHGQKVEHCTYSSSDSRTTFVPEGDFLRCRKPAGVPFPEKVRVSCSVLMDAYCSFNEEGLLPVEAYTGSDPQILKRLTYYKMDDAFASLVKGMLSQLPPGTPANRQLHFLLEKMRDHMTYTTHHLTKTLTETWDLKNGDCGNYADLAVGMAVLAGIPAKTVFGWYVVEDKKYKTHVACELYSQSRGQWLYIDQMFELYAIRSNVVIQSELIEHGDTRGLTTLTVLVNKANIIKFDSELLG